MLAQLVSTYHLHQIVNHFIIALLTSGIAAEIFSRRGDPAFSRPGGFRIRLASVDLTGAPIRADLESHPALIYPLNQEPASVAHLGARTSTPGRTPSTRI